MIVRGDSKPESAPATLGMGLPIAATIARAKAA